MHPRARAHVLSSLAVVLYVAAPIMIMLTAHETVRIDRLERSAASGVTASRRAMLETCGSAGKGASEGGCTFPVTES